MPTKRQAEVMRLISAAGPEGVAGSTLSHADRLIVTRLLGDGDLIEIMGGRDRDDYKKGLLTIARCRVRLTPAGYGAIGEDPKKKIAISTHPRINERQTAALRQIATRRGAGVAGYEFDPYILRALQGLCRAEAMHRLTSWKRLDGTGRSNSADDLETMPKDLRYWLTTEAKLFLAGELHIETYVRPPQQWSLVRVKKPPSPEMIERIRNLKFGESLDDE